MPATIILIEEKLLSQQAILTIYRTRALRGGKKITTTFIVAWRTNSLVIKGKDPGGRCLSFGLGKTN